MFKTKTKKQIQKFIIYFNFSIYFTLLTAVPLFYGLMIHNVDLAFNANVLSNDLQIYQHNNNLNLSDFREWSDDTGFEDVNMLKGYIFSSKMMIVLFLIYPIIVLNFFNSYKEYTQLKEKLKTQANIKINIKRRGK